MWVKLRHKLYIVFEKCCVMFRKAHVFDIFKPHTSMYSHSFFTKMANKYLENSFSKSKLEKNNYRKSEKGLLGTLGSVFVKAVILEKSGVEQDHTLTPFPVHLLFVMPILITQRGKKGGMESGSVCVKEVILEKVQLKIKTHFYHVSSCPFLHYILGIHIVR